MPKIAEIIRQSETTLQNVTETPRLDAEILLAHALGITRAQLLARQNEPASTDSFDTLLERRAQSEPIAYILGEWEFFSLPFYVRPPVLVPRPETEHLVEVVLHEIEANPKAHVLEIGTGTGCVAVSILKNSDAAMTATDIQPDNLELADENALRHGVRDRLTLLESDMFENIKLESSFDVICSNPPYIALSDKDRLPPAIADYEDPLALFAGADGLSSINVLVSNGKKYLKPGGLLAFEIGMGQYEDVIALMRTEGFLDITHTNDLAGIPRVMYGRTHS